MYPRFIFEQNIYAFFQKKLDEILKIVYFLLLFKVWRSIHNLLIGIFLKFFEVVGK